MARLDINCITSLVGKGLEREYLLLKELLGVYDVYVVGLHYTNFANTVFTRADVNISLEVMMPNTFGLAKENFYFPNPEWYGGVYDRFLPQMTKILCKTKDCERIWKVKLAGDRPERVVYTGFEARDLFDPAIERENKFIHVAGQSEFKNTPAIIDAWKGEHGYSWPSPTPPPLTLITSQPRFQEMAKGVDSITLLNRVTDDELKHLMNSHRFHLMPSQYEGFGHSLHEGIGCGALVLTTNAPPMNEFMGIQTDWGIAPCSREPRMLAVMCTVSPQMVVNSCVRAMNANSAEHYRRSQAARAAFESDRSQFRATILGLLGLSA